MHILIKLSPIVLQCLIQREEYTFMISEKRVLKRISGPEGERK
jgi:hypothetical protein